MKKNPLKRNVPIHNNSASTVSGAKGRMRESIFRRSIAPGLWKWRFRDFSRRSLVFATGLAFCFMLIVVADQVIGFPVPARCIILLLLLLSVPAMAIINMVKAAKSADEMIRHVENADRNYRDSISTSEELVTGKIPCGSEPLMDRQLRQTENLLKKNEITRSIIRHKPLWRSFCILAIPVLIFAAALASYPLGSLWATGRILLPFLKIERLCDFDLVPGNTVIAVGEKCELSITPAIWWIKNIQPQITLKYIDGNMRTVEMREGLAEKLHDFLFFDNYRQSYHWDSPENFETFHYRVRWLWLESPFQEVKVVRFPALKEHSLVITYPSYVKMPPVKYDRFQIIRVLKGSSMKFSGKLSENAKDASLKAAKTVPLYRNGDSIESAAILCDKDMKIALDLANKEGFKNRIQYAYNVNAIPDRAPTAVLSAVEDFAELPKILFVSTETETGFSFCAEDDYALDNLVLIEEKAGFPDKTSVISCEGRKNMTLDVKFNPAERKCDHGDVFFFHVAAKDFCPDNPPTASDMLVVAVYDPEKLEEKKDDDKKNDKLSEKENEKKEELENISKQMVSWQRALIDKMRMEKHDQANKKNCAVENPSEKSPNAGESPAGGNADKPTASASSGNSASSSNSGGRQGASGTGGKNKGQQQKESRELSQTMQKLVGEQGNLVDNLKQIEDLMKGTGKQDRYEKAMEFAESSRKQLEDGNVGTGKDQAKQALKQMIEMLMTKSFMESGECDSGNGICIKGDKNKSKGKESGRDKSGGGGLGRDKSEGKENSHNGDTWTPKFSHIDDGLKLPEVDPAKLKAALDRFVAEYGEIIMDERTCPPEFRELVVRYFELLAKQKENVEK